MLEDDDTSAVEEAQEAPPEQPVTETQPETEAAQAAPETPDEGTEAKPEEPIRHPKIERRVAHLTRVANEAQRERDELQRQLEAATQALQQNNTAETNAELERLRAENARLKQTNAEQDLNEKRLAVINAGVTAFGEQAWKEHTTMIYSMGAMRQPEFMEALVDIPDAHKLVMHLADDPDQLAALLAKRPAAMAAAMGRMAAELAAVVETKPKEISKAPPPVKPVGAGRVQQPPDMATLAKSDQKAFIEMRNRTAPRHLGGQGKAA